MKMNRMISLLLCVFLMVSVLVIPAQAAGSITIDSVVFEAYEDSYGVEDETLVNVRVTFTAPEGMAQLSVLLTGADFAAVTAENKHQVVYQIQVNTPQTGEIVFPVEKTRIAGAVGQQDADGATLYLRLGGTGVETVKKEVTYKEDTPAFGDLNEDGFENVMDAVLILRYHAGKESLTVKQLKAADVVQDGEVLLNDALRILLYQAGLVDSLVMQP